MSKVSRRRLMRHSLELAAGTVALPAVAGEPDALAIPDSMHARACPSPLPLRHALAARSGRDPPPTQGRHGRVPSHFLNLTPLQDLHGTMTPNGLHYIRDHGGTPNIDPDTHRLLVHGLVERPLVLSMDDLLRFPSVSVTHFLECSGNTSFWKTSGIKLDWTVQDTHGLLSCSEWTGVRLADILAEVGLKPEARWAPGRGGRCAVMTRSVPVEKLLDDAILAYAQNGERLRPEQGYPLRLLLPGYEGNMSVKWLRRLKLRRHAVPDPRGDVEIHRPAAGRLRRPVRLCHGGEVGHHLALWRAEPARPGLSRNSRAGVVGARHDPAGRGLGRWRRVMA